MIDIWRHNNEEYLTQVGVEPGGLPVQGFVLLSYIGTSWQLLLLTKIVAQKNCVLSVVVMELNLMLVQKL